MTDFAYRSKVTFKSQAYRIFVFSIAAISFLLVHLGVEHLGL